MVVAPIRYELENLDCELPDGNITVGAKRFLHVEVLSLVKKPVESTTTSLQSNMKCGVYTRKKYTPCRVVEQTHDVGSIHDKDQGGCSIQDESTRFGLEDLSYANLRFFFFF